MPGGTLRAPTSPAPPAGTGHSQMGLTKSHHRCKWFCCCLPEIPSKIKDEPNRYPCQGFSILVQPQDSAPTPSVGFFAQMPHPKAFCPFPSVPPDVFSLLLHQLSPPHIRVVLASTPSQLSKAELPGGASFLNNPKAPPLDTHFSKKHQGKDLQCQTLQITRLLCEG